MSEETKGKTKNRFTNYLSYAFGEVLLVVIGILIAVQINNWNTNENNKVIAKEYLSNISLDLKRDTSVFQNALIQIEQLIDLKTSGLNNNELENLPIEAIEGVISSSHYNLKINDPTYFSMKDPNVLKIAKYKEIFKDINSYYTFHQDYLVSFNEWEVDLATRESIFWTEHDDFEINSNLPQDSILNSPLNNERKQIIVSRIQSIKGRNFLKLSLQRLLEVKNRYLVIVKVADSLLKKINEVE